MTPRYSMVIRWSERDHAFLVSLPEFDRVSQPCTHGETYEEAARNGSEVLEMLIESYQAQQRPLPEPDLLVAESPPQEAMRPTATGAG
jgi:predicted RNase H-like HicB family nuclease